MNSSLKQVTVNLIPPQYRQDLKLRRSAAWAIRAFLRNPWRLERLDRKRRNEEVEVATVMRAFALLSEFQLEWEDVRIDSRNEPYVMVEMSAWKSP